MTRAAARARRDRRASILAACAVVAVKNVAIVQFGCSGVRRVVDQSNEGLLPASRSWWAATSVFVRSFRSPPRGLGGIGGGVRCVNFRHWQSRLSAPPLVLPVVAQLAALHR